MAIGIGARVSIYDYIPYKTMDINTYPYKYVS